MARIRQKNLLGRGAGASKKETRHKRFWLLDRKKKNLKERYLYSAERKEGSSAAYQKGNSEGELPVPMRKKI
jgi:hypothetical protein